jgi:hypothetical protein
MARTKVAARRTFIPLLEDVIAKNTTQHMKPVRRGKCGKRTKSLKKVQKMHTKCRDAGFDYYQRPSCKKGALIPGVCVQVYKKNKKHKRFKLFKDSL